MNKGETNTLDSILKILTETRVQRSQGNISKEDALKIYKEMRNELAKLDSLEADSNFAFINELF
ncbi:hypothetical protein [Flavobacterium sp.]|uniref:hypothetical protein n=1 Tax=Flavobacterium sp. TaxID=239 RepID=UPI003752B326